jgi:hypothetical protein
MYFSYRPGDFAALHGALCHQLLAYAGPTASRDLHSTHGSKEDSPASWQQQGVVD